MGKYTPQYRNDAIEYAHTVSLAVLCVAWYFGMYMPIDNIAGVPLSTVVVGIRFFGALWASVGLAYFTWGMTDYFLHHGGQDKITKGCMFLLGFTLVWGAIKLFNHFIFG